MTSSLHSSISYIPLHTTTDAESPQSFSITHYLTFHLPYIVPRRISQNQPIHHSFSEKILLCSRQHCRAALCSLHQTHPLLLAIWWHLQPTGMSPRNRLSTWDSSTPCLNKRQAYLWAYLLVYYKSSYSNSHIIILIKCDLLTLLMDFNTQ